MQKKHLINKILKAAQLSVDYETRESRESCGRYDYEDFDKYWEGFSSEKEAAELESHSLNCPLCIAGMARSLEIQKETEKISNTISDDNLIGAASNFVRIKSFYQQEIVAWAAAPDRRGTLGETYGIAVSGDSQTATLIECNAWVANDIEKSGKLELLGRQVESTKSGLTITRPLDYLEEKLERLFSFNPLLRSLNLDRRYINVDLKERILEEASSLSLSIIMAVVNAVYQRKEPASLVYSADIRQDGKLERIGEVSRKLINGRELGVKKFVLSKENEKDCPREILVSPDCEILFFDYLEELFQYLGLTQPRATPAYLPTARSKNPLDEKNQDTTGSPIKSTRSSGQMEWDFIATQTDGFGIDGKQLAPILSIFEDLCQTRRVEGSFSTVFFMGDREDIHSILPGAAFEFERKTALTNIAGQIIELSTIVNGREYGFVIDHNGVLSSIRKVNVDFSGRKDLAPLLTGDNRKYAHLAHLTKALVFFFPPTGRHLHVFFKGKLIGKYLNGRWLETNYPLLEHLLSKTAQQKGISFSALKNTTAAAIAMAEAGLGGIFAFVPDPQCIAAKWENRLLSKLGINLNPLSISDLDQDELICLGKDDGAVITDGDGRIIASRAYFLTDAVETKKWKPGISARHQHACRFSEMTSGVAIVASRYGTVTLYENGIELACL